MGIKIAVALVAVGLVCTYLLALAFKLKEVDLTIVIIVGLLLMFIDLWQSLRSKDE
jgi:hypothetical protein